MTDAKTQAIARQVEAASPDYSAWVSANAGSGKTRVLVERVIRLLMEGVRPERILCLTYTKAAANEMMQRLFARLGEWAMQPDDLLAENMQAVSGEAVDLGRLRQARRLFARALETPGGLKVQTIHAFCQSVLARFPLEAGLPFSFTVIDEATAKSLLARSIEETAATCLTTEDADLKAAFEFLAVETGAEGLHKKLEAVVGKPWLRQSLAAGEEAWLIARLTDALGLEPGEDPDSILQGLMDACPPAAILNRWAAAFAAGAKTDKARSETLRLYTEHPSQKSFVEDYIPIFLTKKLVVDKRFPSKHIKDNHRPMVEEVLAEAKRLQDGLKRHQAATTRDRTRSLFLIAQAVFQRYDTAKRAARLVDFDDIIAKMLGLLSRSSSADWVRYKLDGG
ncbi:MAG: UvrD-helicase domain-containing protein, partial [Pseudomonadota bacterium]